MNDKDDIKELFQKKLENYQAKVNPNIWNRIQAGLGNAAVATGAASSFGLVGKIIISVSIAAAVVIGTILIINIEESTPKKQNLILDFKNENTVIKELTDKIKLEEEPVVDSFDSKNITEVKEVFKTKIIDNSIDYKKIKKQYNIGIKDANNLNVQENIIVRKKVESRDRIEIIIDEINTPRLAPILTSITPKEELIYELDNFNIQIVNQNNQYIGFKVEQIPNDAYVVWDFGDGAIDRTLNPEHFYTEAGIYNVTCKVRTDNEEITKNLEVEIKVLGKIRDLPNAFTPNGDGKNDEFYVDCKNINSFQLTIIDNQQNIIFSTNDINFRWNGFNKKGKPAKEGNYYYIIVAEDESGNTINKYQQLRLQR